MLYDPDEMEHLFAKTREGKVIRTAVDSPYLHRIQKRHFILFNVLPFLGTLLALALLYRRPIGTVEIALFLTMWFLTGFGVTVGFHRMLTHRTFEAHPVVRATLVALGSMAGLGSPISWVAMHRRHHQCADKPGDMHSPNLHGTDFKGRVKGFIHAHLTWMIRHEYPNVNYYVPDLLRDKIVFRISRNYNFYILLGLAVPAAIGGILTESWMGAFLGFLWGGVVRMFAVTNAMWALNSFLHTVGSRPFKVKDRSTNSLLLAILAWGEGWHHNHHAFPRSAWFGLAWYRYDPGYWLIRSLAALGLAWNVEVPTPERIAKQSAAASG